MTETGSFSLQTESSIAEALRLGKTGRVFSLASGWWHGMPVVPAHPHFSVTTYRTPRGSRVQGDLDFLSSTANTVGLNFTSEVISGTSHTGTHIDALCHVSCGDPNAWFGDTSVDENLGDFGALTLDASELGPIISRGVLLDVPKTLGSDHCPPGYKIGPDDLNRAAELQGTAVRPGDAVLIRTGQMKFWPDEGAMSVANGSGVALAGAEWLAEHEPIVVGCDTSNFECIPSGVDGNPFPVHRKLVQECGIPIMEWVYSEELAGAEAYEFLFVCLPLNVRGATGSMIRPVAII